MLTPPGILSSCAVISSTSTHLYSSRCKSVWLHAASGRLTGITMKYRTQPSYKTVPLLLSLSFATGYKLRDVLALFEKTGGDAF